MRKQKKIVVHVTVENHGSAGYCIDVQVAMPHEHTWAWVTDGNYSDAKFTADGFASTYSVLGCVVKRHRINGSSPIFLN